MTTTPLARRVIAPVFDDPQVPFLLRWYWKASSYVKDPIVLYRRAPVSTGSTLAPLTAEDEQRMPVALREYLTDCERTLAAAGFGAPFRARSTATYNVRSCFTLLEHPRDGALCFVLVSQGEYSGPVSSVTFRSDFTDGIEFQTSNSRNVLRTPGRPRVRAVSFPAVHDAAELYRIHRFRVSERARLVATSPLSRGSDPLAFQEREAAQVFDFWVRCGYYRRVNGRALRLTRQGAIFAAWRGLFPWKQITTAGNERKAATILARYRPK
jgi:hypothetical protein